jgi:hypothetical protein
MQRYVLLKLFGLVLLTQVALVAISFAEVFAYSLLVNPGHDESVYEEHANVSAPWISGIFGFIIFFFVSRYWTKKQLPNAFRLALLLPVVYVVWDALMIVLIGVPDWLAFLPIFLLSFCAKALGSVCGHYASRGQA